MLETASSYSERHPGDGRLLGRGVSSGRGGLGIMERLLLGGSADVKSCEVLELHILAVFASVVEELTRRGFAL